MLHSFGHVYSTHQKLHHLFCYSTTCQTGAVDWLTSCYLDILLDFLVPDVTAHIVLQDMDLDRYHGVGERSSLDQVVEGRPIQQEEVEVLRSHREEHGVVDRQIRQKVEGRLGQDSRRPDVVVGVVRQTGCGLGQDMGSGFADIDVEARYDRRKTGVQEPHYH